MEQNKWAQTLISAARTITDRFWVFCPFHCGVLSFFWGVEQAECSWLPLWMKRIKSIATVLTIFYACAKYDGIHNYHGVWISPPCWRDWLLTVTSQQILMSISSSLKYKPGLMHWLEQYTGWPKIWIVWSLSPNLFKKSDLTFPHVFWNQNSEPV